MLAQIEFSRSEQFRGFMERLPERLPANPSRLSILFLSTSIRSGNSFLIGFERQASASRSPTRRIISPFRQFRRARTTPTTRACLRLGKISVRQTVRRKIPLSFVSVCCRRPPRTHLFGDQLPNSPNSNRSSRLSRIDQLPSWHPASTSRVASNWWRHDQERSGVF